MGEGLKRAFAAAKATRVKVSELDVQRAVWQLLARCDCTSYWLSQARETRQTVGIPDLLTFSPIRGFAFIECKSPNGKQSSEQQRFQQQCEVAGITYILAPSVEPIRDWLGAKR